MIFIKEYNLIYIKSKKTASTLMEKLLWQLVTNERKPPKYSTEINGSIFARNDAGKETELRKLFVNNKNINFSHMTLKEVKEYFGNDIFDKALKVSTIRDPYKQIVSLFNHHISRKNLPNKSIQEMVNNNLNLFNNDRKFRQDIFYKWLLLSIEHITKSQMSFYFVDNEYLIDTLIKQENLDLELKVLFDKMGVDEIKKNNIIKQTNNEVNKSPKYFYKSYLNLDSIRLINDYQKKLFEIGNYQIFNTKAELLNKKN